MENISLFARHSFASCVSKGYSFLVKQLPLVSRVMLPYYTVASLFATLFLAYNTKVNVMVTVNGSASLEDVLVTMALYTLAWVASLLALGRLFLMFRRLSAMEMAQNKDLSNDNAKREKSKTFRRTVQLAVRSLPYTVWPFLIGMPGFPIIDPFTKYCSGLTVGYQALVAVGCLLAFIVMAVFCTPLIYTFYCRMMKPRGVVAENDDTVRRLSFKNAYKKTFRCKWKIFSLTLWSGFLCLIACAILLLPGLVATEAYLSSVEDSVNYGMENLIPVRGYVLMVFIGTLALTFCSMIGVAFYSTQMYLFGDIYTKEEK